jgi:hypothetical protein
MFEGCFFKNVTAAKRDAGLEIPLEVQPNGSYKLKRDLSGSLNFIDLSALTEEQKAQLRRAGLVIP